MKWILKEKDGMAWTGLIWLRLQASGWLQSKRVSNNAINFLSSRKKLSFKEACGPCSQSGFILRAFIYIFFSSQIKFIILHSLFVVCSNHASLKVFLPLFEHFTYRASYSYYYVYQLCMHTLCLPLNSMFVNSYNLAHTPARFGTNSMPSSGSPFRCY